MKKQLGERLPEFSADEIAMVQGSNDFYGMNHYCANYIKHGQLEPSADDFLGNVETLMESEAGEIIGPETELDWLRPHAPGFRKLLKWISDRYGRPEIYVTESGVAAKGESSMPLEQCLEDEDRAKYFHDYISAMADARTEDGVDVRGYMAWSLME